MEIKDQPNQNPEKENNSIIQDENPLSVIAMDEKEEIASKPESPAKPQISEVDKNDIIDRLHGKASNLTPVEESINIEDEPEIQREYVSPAESQVVENIEPVLKQIDNSERQSIIYLLRDKAEKGDDEILFDEIDFEELNKQELVDILEEVVQEQDISVIKSQVAKINSAFYQRNKEEIDDELDNFISSGGKKEDFQHIDDPLEVRYNAAIGIYKHNKAKYSQDLEKQKQINLKLKYEILEELKQLVDSEETLKKTYDEFKKLQDKWKEIGMVPASELRNLWQSYHFQVEKFFDKVRINRELRDLDLKKNLEAKLALCEKAEDLIVEKSILKSFKQLQYCHDKWREIGPVPMDVKEDLWERFKGITDKINERRKEYYNELQDQQQRNYDAKLALCEKAKEIVSQSFDTLKGWQVATDKVNDLLKLWKTISRAPKSKNDEVWVNFKEYLDSFFNAKREYLNELKELQVNNYNLKLDLCAKAEAIKDSSDWGITTRELIKLQQDWKEIGPVPRKYSDKIWKRFRASCDVFFKRKTSHFKSMHIVEDENLQKKKDLISKIVNYKDEKNKEANLFALKDFQKQWIELGFVPFKEKEKIQNEYRAAIDKLIAKMDVNKADLTAADFKNKLDVLKNSPDAGKRLSKERTFITGNIKKIKEDLAIWENNIGFFSNSKQANKLKEEFEQKIVGAKNEIKSLKARLKLIDSE
ncbi:MAG: DUF349 domain-containing protein [Bacteroidetes bacterium]|nr:DUF349 domain-containing protein [Bacteroidota bacterium]MBL6943708.1 DUF349 domain-containing protein [Bacteroidales bacterium]